MMGVCWKVGHADTCEAFELNKGPWVLLLKYATTTPCAHGEFCVLRSDFDAGEAGALCFEDARGGWAANTEPAYFVRVMDRLLAFLRLHPGACLHSDDADDGYPWDFKVVDDRFEPTYVGRE